MSKPGLINIIEVIPISRNPHTSGSLSYFSTKNLTPGDLVEISIRGKNTPSIVKEVRSAKEIKGELKMRPFRLKPLGNVLIKNFFNDASFRILARLSETTLAPQGFLLHKIIPKPFFKETKGSMKPAAENSEKRYHRMLALKGSRRERIIDYRTLIREHFAKGQSLMLISLRIEDVQDFSREFGRNIDNYCFSFSSELSPKIYEERLRKARGSDHPILIIATPQFLMFDRADLETIILDDEGQSLYHVEERPHLDFRKLAEIIAEERKLKLIFAGEVLRVQTIWRSESGEIEPINSLLTRIQSRVSVKLIEFSPNKNDKLYWFSPEAISELDSAFRSPGKVLVFVNRRGYSSFTVCEDCGRTVICSFCSSPLVLHAKKGEEKKFLCHHCLNIIPLPGRCQHCSSWRLKDYGIGIQKIEEELGILFPGKKIFRIEKEVSGKRTARPSEIDSEIKKADIVLSTEKILSYPNYSFSTTLIVSLDHLFTIPDFRMNEKIFRLISNLKEKTESRLLLQTRFEGKEILKDALAGNISRLYQAEITERMNLGYPPFSKIILLAGSELNLSKLKQEVGQIKSLLEVYSPISFPAFIKKIKNRHQWNILLKMRQDKFLSDKNLSKILSDLPLNWRVIVDPESIL